MATRAGKCFILPISLDKTDSLQEALVGVSTMKITRKAKVRFEYLVHESEADDIKDLEVPSHRCRKVEELEILLDH